MFPRYCHKMVLPSPRFHRCKPGLIEEVTLQVDRTDRTRVRKYRNKGYYMLFLCFEFHDDVSHRQDAIIVSPEVSRALDV